VLRRNLYSLDQEDASSKLAKDLIAALRPAKDSQPSTDFLEVRL